MTTLARPPLPPGVRARCEATIERLIAFLDQFEPDTELEPSLGSYPGHLPWDAEADDDGEPSLGSPESVTCAEQRFLPRSRNTYDRTGDQTHWNQGSGEDCELDPSDDEPDLGAPEQRPVETVCIDGLWFERHTDQADWAAGCDDNREGDLADTADDHEHDPAESGIGDADGLNEQMAIFGGNIGDIRTV